MAEFDEHELKTMHKSGEAQPAFTYPGKCNQLVRGGGLCKLTKDHNGYHSTVVFGCDACGNDYRGQPHSILRDGYGDFVAQFCFLCCLEEERNYMGKNHRRRKKKKKNV